VCGAEGGVDSPKFLSHPMGQTGKWWNLVSIKRQKYCNKLHKAVCVLSPTKFQFFEKWGEIAGI
jgi:hypothetical protein